MDRLSSVGLAPVRSGGSCVVACRTGALSKLRIGRGVDAEAGTLRAAGQPQPVPMVRAPGPSRIRAAAPAVVGIWLGPRSSGGVADGVLASTRVAGARGG